MKRALLMFFGLVTVLRADDPLTFEQVAADQKLWPREVVVNVPLKVPVIVNGKLSGSMQAPAGGTYPLKSLVAEGLIIDTQGVPLTIPAAETDLLARAEAVRARLAAQAEAKPTPLRPAATPSPSATATSNKVVKELKNSLVALQDRKLSFLDAGKLEEKKFFAVYFAANEPSSRGFTPDLVRWYEGKKRFKAKFDVIFVSKDHSEEEMEAHMKEFKMPWPAVAFDKLEKSPLRQYEAKGIPCLVIIDGKGEVISHTYRGETFVGPQKVLKDLEGLVKFKEP